MANLNRFAFHETDIPFPSILLLRDNRPCAAVGYLRECTGTIVVSEPVVFLDTSGDVRRALCGQLIGQVRRRAVSEGFQRLHLLLPASASATSIEGLAAEHGFVQAADIFQWESTVAARDQCSPPDRSKFPLYSFPANDVASAGEIQRAIAAILACSEDLAGQPQPTAAELLTKWQRMQARLFLCRSGPEIAGLMSCVTNSIRSGGATVSSAAWISETNVCIEYIGVMPAFRRRQIASLMIREIPVLLSLEGDSHRRASQRLAAWQGPVTLHPDETGGSDQIIDPDTLSEVAPQALRVTAYSDAANTPANGLYQRCGFVQITRLRLWCCDLGKVHDDGCG